MGRVRSIARDTIMYKPKSDPSCGCGYVLLNRVQCVFEFLNDYCTYLVQTGGYNATVQRVGNSQPVYEEGDIVFTHGGKRRAL